MAGDFGSGREEPRRALHPGPRAGEGRKLRKLTLDDIEDLRAYERSRDEFRRRIMDLKRRRRISLGPIVTLTFENTDTMRYQVQEMARAERMLEDDQIRTEVDTYNQLVPDDNELSATLFIELTSKEALQEWLPKLVGIQRAVRFVLAGGIEVPPIPQDEERLTRDDVTASVHYVKFAFPSGTSLDGARVVVDHPAYAHEVTLSTEQAAELQRDLAV